LRVTNESAMNLPSPDPAFHWTAEPWGHALRCRPLESVAQHLFTTRQLALRAPAASDAERAWTQAAASLGAGVEQVMRVKQVHGRTVRILRSGQIAPSATDERPQADALTSNHVDLVLVVQVADCVPALIADSRTGAAAAVHAGWRGSCAGVARAAIETMQREFGTDPRDLIVALGPSIGPCCYDVGPDVVTALREAGWNDDQLSRWFVRSDDGPLRLDLWSANRDQIRDAGVAPENIHVSGLCTKTHVDVFDSYRAAGAAAGRMAGMIRVPGKAG
jgi:polyphenol oxidase